VAKKTGATCVAAAKTGDLLSIIGSGIDKKLGTALKELDLIKL
jgi:hypothetical protein